MNSSVVQGVLTIPNEKPQKLSAELSEKSLKGLKAAVLQIQTTVGETLTEKIEALATEPARKRSKGDDS